MSIRSVDGSLSVLPYPTFFIYDNLIINSKTFFNKFTPSLYDLDTAIMLIVPDVNESNNIIQRPYLFPISKLNLSIRACLKNYLILILKIF